MVTATLDGHTPTTVSWVHAHSGIFANWMYLRAMVLLVQPTVGDRAGLRPRRCSKGGRSYQFTSPRARYRAATFMETFMEVSRHSLCSPPSSGGANETALHD